MFEIKREDIHQILCDFGISVGVKSYVELQRYDYDEKKSAEKEVRLILKVELENGRVLVIRLKNEAGVSQELIEAQGEFANLLLENGIDTPRQYRANQNYTKWYFINGYEVLVMVEDFVEGELRCVDTEIAEKIGELLARMHNIAEKAEFHVQNEVLFHPLKENDLFSLSEFQRHEEKLLTLEPELFQKITKQYEAYLRKIKIFQSEPCYAVQGDISDCNLYRAGEGQVGVFDFNRCGDNNLFFDAIMQAIFEARLMDYPQEYNKCPEEHILPAFLQGYHRERPFSELQREVYPYLYAIINAFWSGDIRWNDDSLYQGIEKNEPEKIRYWMGEIYKRLQYLPQMPIE